MSPYITNMTPDEQALLLTVARILRATIQDMQPTAMGRADIDDLNDALQPFDGNGHEQPGERKADAHP